MAYKRRLTKFYSHTTDRWWYVVEEEQGENNWRRIAETIESSEEDTLKSLARLDRGEQVEVIREL